MKNSVKLLADRDKRVCEVANMVGYSDYRYFCEVFKKNFGMTPSEYRKGHLIKRSK
jgi:two-component system response regulator YesN